MPDKLLETAALIALLRRADRPWHHYSDLVEAAGSASAVLNGEFEDDERPLTLFEEERQPAPDLDPIQEEITSWEADGIAVLSVLDAAYPANLRTIHNRPPLLLIRGHLTAGDERSVAVVGTRRPSEDGLRYAREVASGLSEARY